MNLTESILIKTNNVILNEVKNPLRAWDVLKHPTPQADSSLRLPDFVVQAGSE